MKPIKVTDLEKMTTHEVADLLANIVLVLRRLPNVAMIDLQPIERTVDTAGIVASVRQEKPKSNGNSGKLPDWTIKDEGSHDDEVRDESPRQLRNERGTDDEHNQ